MATLLLHELQDASDLLLDSDDKVLCRAISYRLVRSPLLQVRRGR